MLIKKLRDTLLATAAAGALVIGMGVGSANAASIASLLYTNTSFDDDSAESIGFDAGIIGYLEVGDSLRGILRVDTIIDAGGPGPDIDISSASDHNELAAVFESVVTSAIQVAGAATVADLTDDVFNYTFGPSATFQAEMEAVGGLAAGDLLGAMVVFFEDPTHEYTVKTTGINTGSGCTTTGSGGDCESNIIDGSLIFAIGHSGAAGESWTANFAPALIGVLNDIDNDFGAALFNVTASTIYTAPGFPPTTGAAPEWVGSGFIQGSCSITVAPGTCGTAGSGSTVSTVYAATDDVNFGSAFDIAEPGTLGIMGLGLLGLGFVARRRNRQVA